MIQEDALKILKNGHNVFLTGAAGSGKTYLLNAYIQFLKSRGISTGITASTGIAATHMEGITIHSWAGIGIAQTATNQQIEEIIAKKRITRRIQKTQTLIIDEISMLDGDRLDLIEKVTRLARGSWKPFGGLQVILCGDLFQLPPVSKSGEPPIKPIYESAAWRSLDLRICYLHEQYRQGDQALLAILNAIRNGTVDEEVVNRLHQSRSTQLVIDPVKLYSHNPAVDLENERELSNLPDQEHEFVMQIRGVPMIAEALKKGCLAPERLLLKKDAAVMFVKNNFEKGYVNGTLGMVSGFNEAGLPVITIASGKTVTGEPTTWGVEENGKVLAQIEQIPLRLAWAITVHKSQGMTLDAAQVDLSRCFEKGMGYVALSRVRSMEGLKVMGFNSMALQVSEEARIFDEELKERSEEALEELKFEITNKKLETKNKSQILKHPDAFHECSTYGRTQNEIIDNKSPTLEKRSAGKKWTPEEEAKLIIGLRDAKSIENLAEMLGREKGGIKARLRKLGMMK